MTKTTLLGERHHLSPNNCCQITYAGIRSNTRPDEAALETAPAAVENASQVFLVEIGPATKRLVGAVVIHKDAIRLWASSIWTEYIERYEQASDHNRASSSDSSSDSPFSELNSFYDELDEITDEVHRQRDFQYSSIAGLFALDSLCTDFFDYSARRAAVSNLTRSDIPFSCLADHGSEHLLTVGALRAVDPSPCPEQRLLSFWSPVSFNVSTVAAAEQLQRRVFHRETGETVLQYPHFPTASPPATRELSPLWYAWFEKWASEEITQQTERVRFEAFTEQQASRTSFLERQWPAGTILHLTTHGDEFAEFPESPHLMFCCNPCLPEVVHFLDILSRDWSNVDLVFLNACNTQRGPKKVGDNNLSLGWAFLSGGARAVIAMRWPVPDDAAYYFARCFYETWLLSGQDKDVGLAFQQALQKLRAHPRFQKPHQWGAFAVLG